MHEIADVNRRWPFALVIGLLAVAFAFAASAYLRRYSLSLLSAAGIYCCFMLLLIFALAPGMRGGRKAIEQFAVRCRNVFLFVPVWCLPYFVYSAGTGDLRWTALARLLAVAAPVLLIYALFPVREAPKFELQDAAVAILLITAVLSHALNGIWNVPVNLDFMGRLFLISEASWCWVFVRKVPDLAYEVNISPRVLKAAGVNFLYFALIAIPSGLVMRFTAWNPRWPGVWKFCLDYLEIFLFVALLEELFFRGFLQTLISARLGSASVGQAIVSCLFGLFHILHAPFPNWRYVALASVAGWFYGSAFRSGGNLTASTLMHASVDVVWRTWLTATPLRH